MSSAYVTDKSLGELIRENRDRISQEWKAGFHARHLALEEQVAYSSSQNAESLLEALIRQADMESVLADQPATDLSSLAICAERYAEEHLMANRTEAQLVLGLQSLRSSVLQILIEQENTRNQTDTKNFLRIEQIFAKAMSTALEHYCYIRNRCEARFLKTLAHDVRNALGGLDLMPQLLLQDGMQTANRLQKIAASIDRCVDSTVKIVDRISDLGSIYAGIGIALYPTRLDLGALCEEIVDGLKSRHPDHPILFENTGTFTGFFDRRRMSQLFTTLIGNALQHGLRNEPVIIRMHAEKEMLAFSVWNACEPTVLQRAGSMFLPMQRYIEQILSAGDPGPSLGIGLYISEEIVQAHEGNISVKPENNCITFEVKLPLHGLDSRQDIL